jgi:hypothetical protein
MKPLSIDVPASLPWRLKMACVAAEKLMVEEVLAFHRAVDRGIGEGITARGIRRKGDGNDG